MDHRQNTNTGHSNFRHWYRYVKCIRHNSKRTTNQQSKKYLEQGWNKDSESPSTRDHIRSQSRKYSNNHILSIWFNNALQHLKEEMGKRQVDAREINMQWTERIKSNFLTVISLPNYSKERKGYIKKQRTRLTNKYLLVNEDKHENTT